MTIETLISSYEEDKKIKNETISKINKEIVSMESKTAKKVVLELINSNTDLDMTLIEKHFSSKECINIILAIFEKRGCRITEVKPELLNHLERTYHLKDTKRFKKIHTLFKKVFDNFEDHIKFDISIFCSGTCSIHSLFDFSREFLAKELAISDHFGENNSFTISGSYSYNERKSKFQVSFKQNDLVTNLEEMTNSVLKLASYNYSLNLDLFEAGLNQCSTYEISFDKDSGNVILIRNNDEYKYFEGTLKEQALACFQFCAKRLWYIQTEEEDECF
jgi:hypothetical protein